MPATLALRIREMEPQGFRLDGVVTVVDCKNFPGYEDTSPSAKASLPLPPSLQGNTSNRLVASEIH